MRWRGMSSHAGAQHTWLFTVGAAQMFLLSSSQSVVNSLKSAWCAFAIPHTVFSILAPHHHTSPHPSPFRSLCSRGVMGNLLKVLACAENEHGPIIYLDFEREIPSFLFLLLYFTHSVIFLSFLPILSVWSCLYVHHIMVWFSAFWTAHNQASSHSHSGSKITLHWIEHWIYNLKLLKLIFC